MVFPFGMIFATVLIGAFLVSSKVNADDTDVVDQINITVPTSCTMSGTGMNSHNAEINNNTYTPNIGTTTLHAFCNDTNGFAIYAAGYTGDEIGGENSTKLVGTPSGIGNIVTGTAENGSTSNWAMKLAISQDSGDTTGTNAVAIDNGFNNYHAVPAEYTKVAHKNTSTDMTESTGGVKLTTTYAAFISQTQPAGTYAGQVIYTLVHPVDALPPSPTSVVPPYSCPNAIPNITYMQDLNSSNKASVLASMTEDARYYLADKRDDKAYCVAKLRDGNIWMIQNLDHDIVMDGSVVYNSTTTDLPANTTWEPSVATYATDDDTWMSSAEIPESYDPGDLYWSGVLQDGTPVSSGDSYYHLGNYYSWTAAAAVNDSTSYDGVNVDVNRSICPANWMLPKAGNNTGNGSFLYLINQYDTWDSDSFMMENGYDIHDSPIYFGFFGDWYGEIDGFGNVNNFWSSVVNTSSWSYEYYSDYDGLISPGVGYDGRTYGFSVRCLAR